MLPGQLPDVPALLEAGTPASAFGGTVEQLTEGFDIFAEIAQLVERRTENPGVPSSILGLGI